MSLSMVSEKCYCPRCGRAYGSRKTAFQTSYAAMYKGVGFLPICKECVTSLFTSYLVQCNDQKLAVKQMCRKLDLYWSEQVYEYVEKKSSQRTVMSLYIQRTNNVYYAGKSYDDTLVEQGTLWSDLPSDEKKEPEEETKEDVTSSVEQEMQQRYIVHELPPIEITEDVVAFWGPGYTPEMYIELEQRLQYYRSQMGDTQQDMSTDALLRQIVMLEIDINKARADGRSVDKMMTTFNTLLSSLIKPVKKSDDTISGSSSTPLGVWIKRWEDERPLPEIDDSLRDVDGIVKYVLTWVYGHVAHMLGVRNNHSKLYEEAIEKYRVNRPEYDDEDDDTMLYDIFQDSGGSSDKTG